jgi:hypothetical protein
MSIAVCSWRVKVVGRVAVDRHWWVGKEEQDGARTRTRGLSAKLPLKVVFAWDAEQRGGRRPTLGGVLGQQARIQRMSLGAADLRLSEMVDRGRVEGAHHMARLV